MTVTQGVMSETTPCLLNAGKQIPDSLQALISVLSTTGMWKTTSSYQDYG